MATIGQRKAKKAGGSYTSSRTGVTYKSDGSTSGGSSGSASAPTGSPERTAYLQSLNRQGSANYVPTPDDAGMENIDTINNDKALQTMANVNPELADKKMDKMGYTSTPGTPQVNVGQPSPSTSTIAPPSGGQPVDLATNQRTGFANAQATLGNTMVDSAAKAV